MDWFVDRYLGAHLTTKRHSWVAEFRVYGYWDSFLKNETRIASSNKKKTRRLNWIDLAWFGQWWFLFCVISTWRFSVNMGEFFLQGQGYVRSVRWGICGYGIIRKRDEERGTVGSWQSADWNVTYVQRMGSMSIRQSNITIYTLLFFFKTRFPK